jgi:hypothetical protein
MDRLESDIMAYLPTILRGADLEKSTVKSLQKELETKLGMGLSEKKNFIREQVRARISESESSPLRLSRWCGFEILSNECDAGYDGRVRVRDDVSIDTLASFRRRRRRRRRRRARTTPSSVVAAIIREENQFLPFEPCASFPYTECSCELCGIWILPATEPTPVGRRVRRTRVADIRMDD